MLQKVVSIRGDHSKEYKTLYITPMLINFWLWSEWWDAHGSNFDPGRFARIDESDASSELLPESMLEGFYGMFRYAKESPNAAEVARRMLWPKGPFGDGSLLGTSAGARLFHTLMRVEPRLALERLGGTIGTWDRERLLSFTVGRREVVWGLEHAAHEPDNFDDAARMLLRLAAAENEGVANNATGVFAGLFSLAPGRLARTDTDADAKVTLLEEVINSDDAAERMCALRACDAALESSHFTRMDYRTNSMLYMDARDWKPGRQEMLAYRRIIGMLTSRLDGMDGPERQQAIRTIAKHARTLTRLEPLARLLTDTIRSISKRYRDMDTMETIISEVEMIVSIEHGRLSPETMALWENLRAELGTGDFHSRMERYVGMNVLMTDYNEPARTERAARIRELALESVEEKQKLLDEMGWLCTDKAKNSIEFGYELGRTDANLSLLSDILDSQDAGSPRYSCAMLGGYLRALFERDVDGWESVLDRMSGDPSLCRLLTEATVRSGITDRAGTRIARAYRKGSIERSGLAVLTHTPRLRNFSEGVFLDLVEILMDDADYAALDTALVMYALYYADGDSAPSPPESVTFRLIAHDLLMQEPPSSGSMYLSRVHWAMIVTMFVRRFPGRMPQLADVLLKNMGKMNNILGMNNPETHKVLDMICASGPAEMWEAAHKYIGPPRDERADAILIWMRGLAEDRDRTAFSMMPLDGIFAWIDARPDERAPHLAWFVPKIPFDQKEGCVAREFLVRYGDRKDVRDALHGRFLSGVWQGSGVDHYTKEKEAYTRLKDHEKNTRVMQWFSDHIDILKRQIENETAMEERYDNPSSPV